MSQGARQRGATGSGGHLLVLNRDLVLNLNLVIAGEIKKKITIKKSED